MQTAALRVIRTSNRLVLRRPCRTVAGVRNRHPHQPLLSSRAFHPSPTSLRAPEDPAVSAASDSAKPQPEVAEITPEDAVVEGDGTNVETDTAKTVDDAEVEDLNPQVKSRNGRTGTVRRGRPKVQEGLPPVVLPEWFWEKNVRCVGEPPLRGPLAVYGTSSASLGELGDILENSEETGKENAGEKEIKVDSESSTEPETASQGVKVKEDTTGLSSRFKDQFDAILMCDLVPTKDARYTMHVDVYREIFATLKTGLRLRPPKNSASPLINKPVTLLQCPKDGGSYYLDSAVETIAAKLNADLISLDVHDISQIVGSHFEDNPAWSQSAHAMLAYETHRYAGKLEELEQDIAETPEEDEEDSKPVPIKTLTTRVSSFLSRMKLPFDRPTRIPGFSLLLEPPQNSQLTESDQWGGLKLSTIFNTLIDAPSSKRASAESDSASDSKPSSGTIILVRDYKSLSATPRGSELLARLRTAIHTRWKEGHDIVCIGTNSTCETSIDENGSALSKVDIQKLQSDIVEGEKRTIFVPPDRRDHQDEIFELDEKARIRNINVRHIENMIESLLEGMPELSPVIDVEKDLDILTVESTGLEEAVWTYARVHRVATTVIGLVDSPSVIDGEIFSKALNLLAWSDDAKFTWGAEELKAEDDDAADMIRSGEESSSTKSKDITKEKLKQIRKNCKAHEKKLLGGVILPSELHTTFNDIRAPKETIEALKTLTSLSLIRPEAFSYGVLATDKIPGLLLYGPPGTGKTLLAKAVAKESGATMLEISGAEVNDMYVGEGEKNVKAVFTLAKKLSPCVVFIDEADAIFSARGDAKPRSSSHRELINQFLREWDGMNDLGALIMICTNRPFDLDEAVLRRVPRRLLVDLPVEKDREAILKIHLKDEILDESVSLSELAKDTPFYSGSDLKNVSVAAAMACIREENEEAAKHTGTEPYVFPPVRTLKKAHFVKALEEISASVSEDMSTLSAIRKFDEKYGDRKGRRKKASALGFGGTTIPEKDSESARVRKLVV